MKLETASDIPKLKYSQILKGAEPFGCFNTGVAPILTRVRVNERGIGLGPKSTVYVVGTEYPARDVRKYLRSVGTIPASVKKEMKGKVKVYKTRKAAVNAFLRLQGQMVKSIREDRGEYDKARKEAAKGDLEAVLRLGDF